MKENATKTQRKITNSKLIIKTIGLIIYFTLGIGISIAAGLTLFPSSASKPNFLGYFSECSFVPISTLILIVISIGCFKMLAIRWDQFKNILNTTQTPENDAKINGNQKFLNKSCQDPQKKFFLWFIMPLIIGAGIGVITENLIIAAGIGAMIGILMWALVSDNSKRNHGK